MDPKFKKNFLKGSAAATIGQSSSMVFHFLSIMLLTRGLSVFDFGIYSLSIVVAYLFNTISSLGLEVTLVKFISGENNEDKKQVFLPTLYIKIISASFVSIVFFLISKTILGLFGKGIESYSIYINIMFFLGTFRDHFFNLFQGLNLFRKYATVQILAAFIRFSSILLLLWLKTINLQNVLLIEIITLVFTITLQLFNIPYRKIISPFSGFNIYKKIFNFCTPVYLNNIFHIIYGRANYFIIGAFLSPISIAFYDIAYKIPDSLKKLFDSFILVYFPNLSKLLARGELREGEELMNKSLSFFSLFITSLVFLSFLFQKEIIVLLFSYKYINAAMALSLLILNFQFITNVNIMGYSILSAGFPSIPMKINIVSSIISIAGGLIMIPKWGFLGAVYTVLIMNIVSQLLNYINLRKISIKADLLKQLKPLLIVTILLVLYFLIGFNSILFKISYFLLYIILSTIFIKDIKNIFSSMLRSIRLFR